MNTRYDRSILNILTGFLAWGWPVILILIVTPVLVRGLGDDGYGIRTLIISIIGYFALMDLGLGSAITKYLAEYEAKKDNKLVTELLGTTLSVHFVIGVIGGVSIWLLSEWFTVTIFKVPELLQEESIWSFRITGIGFLIHALLWWASSISAGLQRYDLYNWVSIGFGTLTSIGSLVAVWLGGGLRWVIIANVISSIVALIAYLIVNKKILPDIPLRLSFEWEMFKRTSYFGFFLVILRISGIIITHLDRTLVGMWLGTAMVTYYVIPYAVSSYVHQLCAKIFLFTGPMASEFNQSNAGKVHFLFLRSFNLNFVFAVGLSFPMFILASPFLKFWMGEEFVRISAPVMQLTVIYFFFIATLVAVTCIFGGIGFPQIIAASAVFDGIIHVIGYFLLIRSMGIIGLGWIAAFSGILVFLFNIFWVKKIIKIPFQKIISIMWKPLLIGSCISIFFYFLIIPLIIGFFSTLAVGTVMLFTYSIACWILDVFDEKEKKALVGFLTKRFSGVSKRRISNLTNRFQGE